MAMLLATESEANSHVVIPMPEWDRNQRARGVVHHRRKLRSAARKRAIRERAVIRSRARLGGDAA